MIVAAALLLAGAGSLELIARELRKAPEGYEDDHGFHTVYQDTGGRLKQKVAVEPTATFACKISSGIETFAGSTHYVTPRYTECAEGRTEQHDCGAAIGNPWSAWAKEYPPGKAMVTRTIFRNRDYST